MHIQEEMYAGSIRPGKRGCKQNRQYIQIIKQLLPSCTAHEEAKASHQMGAVFKLGNIRIHLDNMKEFIKMRVKQFRNLGIELTASLTQNLRSRLFRRPQIFIAAFAYQRVKNIGDRDTPGVQIDALPFKPVLVPLTIKSFMVLPGDAVRKLHNFSWCVFQKLMSIIDVLFDLGEFIFCELAGFMQDFPRDTDFTYIMHHTCHTYFPGFRKLS